MPEPFDCTIIVISIVGASATRRLVDILADLPCELLVASETPIDGLSSSAGLALSPGTIPQRRYQAANLARGRWIVFLEDTCEPTERWFDVLQELSKLPVDSLSGPVIISHDATARSIAYAAIDYGRASMQPTGST